MRSLIRTPITWGMQGNWDEAVKVSFQAPQDENRIKSVSIGLSFDDYDYALFTDATGKARSHTFVLKDIWKRPGEDSVIHACIGIEDTDGNLSYTQYARSLANEYGHPCIVNMRGFQREDGSGLVDFFYDYTEEREVAFGNATLKISSDDGQTYDVPITTAIGDIGSGIRTGLDRHIVWDPTVDAVKVSNKWLTAVITMTSASGTPAVGDMVSGTFVIDLPASKARPSVLFVENEKAQYGEIGGEDIKNRDLPIVIAESSSSTSESIISTSGSQSTQSQKSSSQSMAPCLWMPPNMTSDSTPYPFIIYSSPSTSPGWKACDSDILTSCWNAPIPAYLQIYMGPGSVNPYHNPSKYRICVGTSKVPKSYWPYSWKLYGISGSWHLLDSRDLFDSWSYSATLGSYAEFNISDHGPFSWYHLSVSRVRSGTVLRVYDLRIYSCYNESSSSTSSRSSMSSLSSSSFNSSSSTVFMSSSSSVSPSSESSSSTTSNMALTPIMTDWNVPPPYEVTESSYSYGRRGWRAFDGDYSGSSNSSWWFNLDANPTTHPEWVELYYGGEKEYVTGYSITAYSHATAPVTWILKGSLDGSIWKVVDHRENQVFSGHPLQLSFVIQDPGAYRRYKLEVYQCGGYSGNLTLISGIKFS